MGLRYLDSLGVSLNLFQFICKPFSSDLLTAHSKRAEVIKNNICADVHAYPVIYSQKIIDMFDM